MIIYMVLRKLKRFIVKLSNYHERVTCGSATHPVTYEENMQKHSPEMISNNATT